MNYDLFLFNGHGDGDMGACYNGYKEQVLAKKLVNRVIEILKPYNINIHTNGDLNNYNRNLTKGNKYKYVEGLCIHLNATTNHNANGTEIIIPSKLASFSMEQDILNGIAALGFYNRGVKSRDYNSEQFIKRINGSACSFKDYYKEIRECYNNGYYLSILEVCFIDSSDINLFNSKFESIAQVIANAIIKRYCLKKSTSENVVYRVITGSYSNKANADKRVEELKKKGYDSFIEVKK